MEKNFNCILLIALGVLTLLVLTEPRNCETANVTPAPDLVEDDSPSVISFGSRSNASRKKQKGKRPSKNRDVTTAEAVIPEDDTDYADDVTEIAVDIDVDVSISSEAESDVSTEILAAPPVGTLTRETVDSGCRCGLKKSFDMKIVGGSLAREHAWPWMAALVYVAGGTPKVFCGGSLINNRYVLTAAHCVEDIVKNGLSNFQVYLGTNIIAINGTSSQANVTLTPTVYASMSAVIAHPEYDQSTLNNDMALIKLAAPVSYSNSVTSVCLGQGGAPHSGRPAVVAGWGAIKTNSLPVNKLRNTKVNILSNSACEAFYRKIQVKITPGMVCATGRKRDACRGDSGGPLFVQRAKNSRVFDLVGVVSFGQECGNPDFPGVYARVGRYMKWIKENTQDAVYCARSFRES